MGSPDAVEPDAPARHGFAQAFARALPDADATRAAVASGVAVAVFDLAPWRQHLDGADALIGPEAAARAGRQRLPAQRDALRLAYALHRLVLAQALDCTPDAVGLFRDGKGCPRLPDDRLYTSLSHAGDRVAIAVSAIGPVGIDLEPAVRALDMAELEERVAHPRERQALAALPPALRGHALLELWVRKEALLKAAGIGLELEMDVFEAPPDATLPLPGGRWQGRPVRLHSLACDEPWVMAMAAPPEAAPDTLYRPHPGGAD
ncbi:4'-phosphopantetheinyl transferase family protein [Luteimonas kalidii]|uniref:4'-phosphopantetheinyl transferase superfamily protein n=1 Tax=Luteimonas kalidii TaxID=3042025 RepID=A0ABT6JTB1_9GAMM|nr:4'-phosphopantetheinyl transferase superfamily protein [Luteimonas kalidii]MDH5833933.1 4'-phosphopantetheinyl transferase superfamily protein [Luteimonas kalidii]